MKHFVPLRDGLMECLGDSRLVPYRVGLPCLHWEAAICDPRSEKTLMEFISGSSADVPPAVPQDDLQSRP